MPAMSAIRLLASFLATCLATTAGLAISVDPLSLDDRADRSGLIGRGTVEAVIASRNAEGLIFSEATIRMTETFKGRFPARVTLRYRGGEVADGGESLAGQPELRPGEERIFFLTAVKDGSFQIMAGPEGAPLIETPGTAKAPGLQTLKWMRARFPRPAQGMAFEESSSPERSATAAPTPAAPQVSSTEVEGLLLPPRRSTLADRGAPIDYLVDADALPAGISLEQALLAVENALSAWTAASSVTFRFEGLQSFGMAANDLVTDDGRLRIQLHDTYEAINNASNVLGIGGQSYQWNGDFSDGGTGGRVQDVEFHLATRSFVIIEHTSSSLGALHTFKSVIGHEVGHALGLSHSSEDPDETDPELSKALMYYRTQANPQGAELTAWDLAAVLRAHPLVPPPFGFDRVIRAVTGFNELTNPNVNQVDLRGRSLNGGSPSPQLISPSAHNGSFSLSGMILTYTPAEAFEDSPEIDPAGTDFYDATYVRFSDGANLSPPIEVRVLQYLLDTLPSGAPDGLPNSWMLTHFGSSSPVVGLSGATDDPDEDGLANLQEFLLGTDPRSPHSRLAVASITPAAMQWQARPFDVYEIQTSEDLVSWEWLRTERPEDSTGTFEHPPLDGAARFFRVQRVD